MVSIQLIVVRGAEAYLHRVESRALRNRPSAVEPKARVSNCLEFVDEGIALTDQSNSEPPFKTDHSNTNVQACCKLQSVIRGHALEGRDGLPSAIGQAAYDGRNGRSGTRGRTAEMLI